MFIFLCLIEKKYYAETQNTKELGLNRKNASQKSQIFLPLAELFF